MNDHPSPPGESDESADDRRDSSTAERVEDWLRGLRSQRASGSGESGTKVSRTGDRGGSPEDAAETFLKAARRLAGNLRAQQHLARRLVEQRDGADDPALRALARVLQTLGADLNDVLAAGGPSGGAAVLDRPEVIEAREIELDDAAGGGGNDGDIDDDDNGSGGGGDDEEPWPSAFVGYRTGLIDAIDVGTCRDGCCTAVFIEHPGIRAAIWFPTETAGEIAENLGELLAQEKGESADLGVPPFGTGDAPARGQVQATMQFFTDDVHLEEPETASDRRQGGFARFMAYDQGLGHGGPPLVDVLVSAEQSRALRRAFRRAVKNAPKER